MVASNNGSEQVATQVATSTGTSGGSAGNNTTTGGSGPIASSTPVVAPRGYRHVLQQMLQGWQELIPVDSTLLSSAGSLNQAGVLAELQGYLGVYTDLDTHDTGIRQARAQAESQLPEVRAYYAALKAAVISYFGAKSPQLVKFGLKPRKTPAPLTSTQLAVRAAKVKATRQLRGTKGPVQKAGIKAGPMQISIGPVAVPAAQASPAASTSPPEATVAEASPPAGK
jgi:hypothetical protein